MKKAYVIAEAGTNHAGSYRKAQEYVREAAESGADACKFQAFIPGEPLFCPYPGDEKRMPRWDASALSLVEWEYLVDDAKDLGIDLILSVFQTAALDFVKNPLIPYVKVASRAAMTFPYEEFDKPFLISTGMISTDEHCDIYYKLGKMKKSAAFLYCIPEYPTPLESVDLDMVAKPIVSTLCMSGISDHSGTPWPAIGAMARGATFVEVHFKLGTEAPGPDLTSSVSTGDLKLICEARDAFAAMR